MKATSILCLVFLSTGVSCTTYYKAWPGTGRVGGDMSNGCAPLSDEQKGTIAGRWKLAPIPIAVKANNFVDNNELNAIYEAVKTWNAFSGEVQQLQIINFSTEAPGGGVSVNTTTQETGVIGLCEYTDTVSGMVLNDGSGFVPGRVVGIHKLTQGFAAATGTDDKTIGATQFCHKAGAFPAFPEEEIYDAVILINYENFFVEGKRVPDLQSVLLHEFGHLLGLGHSCGGNAIKTLTYPFPACDPANPSVFEAVMYPTFSFPDNTNGEQKRALTIDDQVRACTLYNRAFTSVVGQQGPPPTPQASPVASPSPSPSAEPTPIETTQQ